MNSQENVKGDLVPPEQHVNELNRLNELPILPIRDMVVFPRLRLPIVVPAHSLEKYKDALSEGSIIGAASLKDGNDKEPTSDNVYETGTIVQIMHTKEFADGTMMLVVNGTDRFRLTDWHTNQSPLKARVVKSPEVMEDDLETDALQRHVRQLVQEVITLSPQIPDEMTQVLSQLTDPLQLAYVLALNATADIQWKQSILEMSSLKEKLSAIASHFEKEKAVLAIGDRIQSEARDSIDKSQREYYLRQQLKAIQKELGETDENDSDADDYAQRIEASEMSEEARTQAKKELTRYSQMSPQSPEHPLVKTYLDWLLELPWNKASEDSSDIKKARGILDADHYGLGDVKDRLIEYLAVRNLTKKRERDTVDENASDEISGVILCLAGPPGVGKTSLGRSVARALGRSFTRMSLGGMRDEAEIRGHRRTYIGAMPGRIIQSIKRAGTINPVFMLDEIDKVGQDWRGDPSSALLEVLDPAQNSTFRDHYLDIDFDLSQVIFIATANQLNTIPTPLRDRMEIIQLDGYTEVEKVQIAKRHLIPRQLKAHRLKVDEVTFMEDAVSKIVRDYTREAGVRNLERQIAAICRKGIVRLTANGWSHVVITPELVREYLKKELFESEHAEPNVIPGITNGLAVTPVGGEILTIEATRMGGSGRLTLTGQLGDVMKESARIALSYVRSQAPALQIDPTIFDRTDVHLHVPAGALPKDGPSAGVAMVSALISLFSDRAVKSGVGITGEITLRGRVLPVGGIKMKVLAAHRAGLTRVILPKRNERDLEDVPDEVRNEIQFIAIDRLEDALETLFEDGLGGNYSAPGESLDPFMNNVSPVHAHCQCDGASTD